MPTFREYSAFEDQVYKEAWRVEDVATTPEEVHIAVFSGPDAERIAHEYAAFKNGKHPAAKPEVITIPTAAPLPEKDTLVVALKTGEVISLNLKSTEWSKDPRNKNAVIGKPKPAFNIIEGKKGQEIC